MKRRRNEDTDISPAAPSKKGGSPGFFVPVCGRILPDPGKKMNPVSMVSTPDRVLNLSRLSPERSP